MEKDGKAQPAALTARQNAWQAAKFTLFSVSAGIVQVVSFTLLNELTGFPYWPSYLIALILSVLYNFTVNRRFTFKSAANVPVAMLKVLGFYAVFTPLSTWLGNTANQRGVNEYIVLGVTMLCNLSLEYLFCRFVVYRGSMNTNDLAAPRSGAKDAPAE
ncbi:MAG: GtrA family protein [Treponema sp.]|jgi:putative flippase GtrA|nr:GtrA family protein [Treponema sp.]